MPELSANVVDVGNQKFKNHPSKKLIKDIMNLCYMFKFESISLGIIVRQVTKLNSAKNAILKNIPTRCLKETSDI